MEIPKTLLVDGDILLFTICRTTEDKTDFGDIQCESFSEEDTIKLLNSGLDSIAKQTGYTREEIVFCMTDDENFRKEFFPTYKQNRKDVKKPLGLKFIREFLKENAEEYQLALMGGLEADDVMGIYGSADPLTMSIYSQDKDLFTIPCRQWCFKKKKFITPEPIESTRFLYTQVLTGDVVDGYGGLKGIGKVKANKALHDCNSEIEMLEACHKMYYTKHKAEAKEKLLEQIGQARILHHQDYLILAQYKETYNPYKLMGVTDEVQALWEGN